MDQRVTDKRRQEAASSREAKPALSDAPKDESWLTRLRERRTLMLAITGIVILIGVGIMVWWVNASGYISTDDAFIDARTSTISPQISAQVVDVPVTVTDNQLVKPGTVLATLDKREYQAQVDQAKAQVDAAQANIANVDAQIGSQQARGDQADKQVVQAQAALSFAQEENERYQGLVKSGSVTVEQAQQYKSNFLQAQANFDAARASTVATQKQLAVLQSQKLQAKAQLQQMHAALQQAQINLSRTDIDARSRAT